MATVMSHHILDPKPILLIAISVIFSVPTDCGAFSTELQEICRFQDEIFQSPAFERAL